MGRLLHLALLSYLALESTAFNFLFPQITGQCGTSRVSWQGGQAPYRIMLACVVSSIPQKHSDRCSDPGP